MESSAGEGRHYRDSIKENSAWVIEMLKSSGGLLN